MNRRSRLSHPRRWFAGALVAGLTMVGLFTLAQASRPAGQDKLSLATTPAPAVAPSSHGESHEAAALGADEELVQGLAPATGGPSPFEAIVAPTPSPTPGPLRPGKHTVEAGETLIAIADRYGLRPETLVWANELDDADLIVVGQELVVPPGDGLLYAVQPGDGLVQLTARYGVDLAQVIRGNAIADADLLRVGETLFLPGARPLAPPGPVAAASPAAPAGTLATLEITPAVQAVLDATWEQTTVESRLYSAPGPDGRALSLVLAGARLERLGGATGRRLPIRDPGDGRTRLAMTGWVDVLDLVPAAPPSPRELPRSYPDNTRMDIPQVFAPYRTQLDGSAYASANCGPTTISMALAAFGVDASPGALRPRVLAAQRIWGNDVGSLITALAEVVESFGVRTVGLREESGAIRRWGLDDLRAQVRDKRPVVVQVSFRGLPGRERAAFFGDHYILLTGLLDDGFLYNDSINSDGPGWDRVISGARLLAAMNATDRRYAYAAFAVAR